MENCTVNIQIAP